MNLFMRSVSILASAAMISLVPFSSFAGVDDVVPTGSSNLIENDCDPGRAKPPGEVAYCDKKAAEAEAKRKERENAKNDTANPTTPTGGNNQNPNGNQGQGEEQPQQSSNSGSGGNCENVQWNADGKANTSGSVGGVPVSSNNDQAGIGKKQACQGLQNFIQRAEQAVQKGRSVGLDGHNFEALKKDFEEYMKNRESCLSGHSTAATMCLENLSPDVANGAAGVNNVLGQVGQNASDTCGKASKAMDLAKNALTAFTGSCGAAKGMCNSSCSKAKAGVEGLLSKAKTALYSTKCLGGNPACDAPKAAYLAALNEGISLGQQEQGATDKESVAGKAKLCQDNYGQMIGSALQGIMGMLAGMQQGNKCEEETNGTAEQKGTLSDKCMLPENASMPECICKANPRTVGCSGAYQSMSANNNGGFGGGMNDKANVDPNGDSGTLDNNGLGNMEQSARSPSGDAAGAPMGGGGAGIGSSTVGAGAGGQNGDAGGGKGLNANILAGTGGGGGGAGGWGAGGAGDKYRQYLPGGAKDPAKSLAGQQAWKNEVTGQGGKSNWEKVKDRYRDNKNTLLNQN